MWNPGLSSHLAYTNAAECARVRAISKERICDREPAHHDGFLIRLISGEKNFYNCFANDIVNRIVQANEAGTTCTMILPVGPVPQYIKATERINREGIDCSNLVTFNMDEYAGKDGTTAPPDWEGSFATAMWRNFFGEIREDLRPREENIHFPSSANIGDYSTMIEDAGEADVCYGGIGWCGHIAFFESHLGEHYADLEEYMQARGQLVELNLMTIMQNALHSFGGDWSWVPPKAVTIGPRDIMKARDRSFWLDGMCGFQTNMSWQRFIARLAAHACPNKDVPGTILQTAPGTYNIYEPVANDVEIDMS